MSDEIFRKLISEIESLKRKIERLQVLENGGGGVTDHGALTGLADDDHTQYIKHSLATAVSDFLVASGTGAFVKKTLAEVKTILGLAAGGWIPVSDTWSYNAANKITVPSGAASIYSVGMGIRLTANGVVLQDYIIKVENTLLTVAGDALTNYTFSAISYTPIPQTAIGFPDWFNWVPTETGWTALPTGTYIFKLDGRLITCFVDTTSGTSDATDATLTLPVTAAAGPVYGGPNSRAVDNDVTITSACRWVIGSGWNYVAFYTNMSISTWTASGTKRIVATLIYKI